MKPRPMTATSIDRYIAAFPPEVRLILERIRLTVRKAAPGAEEKISYQIPSFSFHGPLVYFGAFKNHIGFYPPVREEKLRRETSIYEGEKGNLKFPLDSPIPYALIGRIVKARVRENEERQNARRRKRRNAGNATMKRVQVENANHPGSVKRVDAGMYGTMKRAYLAVLPASAPGLTLAQIQERLTARLPQDLYPAGAKAGWWAKTVQLDLEAKGIIKRVKASPLRLHRA